MPTQALVKCSPLELDDMAQSGRLKGKESVLHGVIPARDGHGPRYLIEGEGDKPFLRMNSNSYLGMALRSEVIAAEEAAAARYGTGPGAVRFISGTWSPHVALERALAAFHGRPAGHAVFIGLCDGHGAYSATRHRQDGGDQRRAQPQLHHQRDLRWRGRPKSTSIGISTWVSSSARSRQSAKKLQPRYCRHRRHLQHARRSRSARPYHGIGARS